MAGHASEIGGSLGGLFANTLLRRRGWTIDVFERSPVELAGRGAGIVTHTPLLKALKNIGTSLDDLSFEIKTRTGYDAQVE